MRTHAGLVLAFAMACSNERDAGSPVEVVRVENPWLKDRVIIPSGTFNGVALSCVDGSTVPRFTEPNWGAPTRRVHEQSLAAYAIDREPTTCTQFADCVSARACDSSPKADCVYSGDYRHDGHDHGMVRAHKPQAEQYCAWQNGKLPTFAQWHRAISGPELGLEIDLPLCPGRVGAPFGRLPPGFDPASPRCEAKSPSGVSYGLHNPNFGEWARDTECFMFAGFELDVRPFIIRLAGSRVGDVQWWIDAGAEFRCVYEFPYGVPAFDPVPMTRFRP